jgi:hypothetical protein
VTDGDNAKGLEILGGITQLLNGTPGTLKATLEAAASSLRLFPVDQRCRPSDAEGFRPMQMQGLGGGLQGRYLPGR